MEKIRVRKFALMALKALLLLLVAYVIVLFIEAFFYWDRLEGDARGNFDIVVYVAIILALVVKFIDIFLVFIGVKKKKDSVFEE